VLAVSRAPLHPSSTVPSSFHRCAVAASALLTLLGACSSGPPSVPRATPSAAGAPFEPVPPRVYVAKVKNILVGLPPTEAEVAAVEADPAALSQLVDAWMQRPEYDQKMPR
jgi:hypothetical protein